MKEQSPDLYQKILDSPFEKELVDLVKTDLPRTFPDNIYFSKEANHQAHLFNILIAYAHSNRVVGYCQGLNYIAGTYPNYVYFPVNKHLIILCSGKINI